MPLWIIGGVMVAYGMSFVVFGFVSPPMFLSGLYIPPPLFPNTTTGQRIGRVVTGLVIMFVPLVIAYVIMRR